MENLIDDNFDSKKSQDINKWKMEINDIESKNWFGIILICVVIGLITISLFISYSIVELELPIVIINLLLITVHIVLLYLTKVDKLIAYSGGLISFLMTFILNIILTKTFFLNNAFIGLVIIGSYIIFIYEELKLKKLKAKINNLI